MLRAWTERKKERDLILKLPTGGGKTLVGLLIARASINELRRPALILAPTRQLVEQIVAEGAKHSVAAEAYLGGSGRPLPPRFLSGEAVGVATYRALFNGKSKFGTTASSFAPVELGTIILDDAHASFDTVRGAFSMTIERHENSELYDELCSTFRGAFAAIDKQSTFDDVVSGEDYIVLEVPHWEWCARAEEVSQHLRKLDHLAWPVLRDELRISHALITPSAFTITPLYPPVHAIPTFYNCKRRVYMSATIADDSEIVRAFGAARESVLKPIAPATLAGVAERMILVPGWMDLPAEVAPNELVLDAIEYAVKNSGNALILTPSFRAAREWDGVGLVADSAKVAEASIQQMQSGDKIGVLILGNRYDGIDLPGDTCRVLVLAGLPRGMSDYDMFRATALSGSVINSTLAQRVEQGIGRAARGAGDYCVVVLSGLDLVSWLGQAGSMDFLTASTRRQIEIGRTLGSAIHSKRDFSGAINQCLKRDRSWVAYHAAELVDAAELAKPDEVRIGIAVAEHEAIDQMRQGRLDRAEKALQAAADSAPDDAIKGWLLQLRSRALNLADDQKGSQTVQSAAFARNRRLTRPLAKMPYQPVRSPGDQARAIVRQISKFVEPHACLADLDMRTAALTPEASSNQFEEALRVVGDYLGFASERPDEDVGDGPDNLWRTDDPFDFVIEAKSRKKRFS